MALQIGMNYSLLFYLWPKSIQFEFAFMRLIEFRAYVCAIIDVPPLPQLNTHTHAHTLIPHI